MYEGIRNFVPMKVEKYISALLYRYQCVVVPHFGAFITETVSSKFNENTKTFSPPKKTLVFNRLLTTNDGLLANHIAVELKVSFEEAMEIIQSEVAEWNKTIQHTGQLVLGGVGILNLNSDGHFVFESIGTSNYLTTSFGLSPVMTSLIFREEEKAKEEIQIEAKVVQINKEPRKTFSLAKYAAAVVLAVGAFGVYNYYDSYQTLQKESFAVEQSVQDKIEKELQQATFYLEVPQIIDEVTTISKQNETQHLKKIHIVAGAFRTDQRAQLMVEELIANGYPNAKYIKKENKNMRPVVYNSYETVEDAKQDLRQIHESVNANAWIYIEK